MIYGSLKRFAGTLGLVVNQAGDIIVESERGAHIMMLGPQAS